MINLLNKSNPDLSKVFQFNQVIWWNDVNIQYIALSSVTLKSNQNQNFDGIFRLSYEMSFPTGSPNQSHQNLVCINSNVVVNIRKQNYNGSLIETLLHELGLFRDGSIAQKERSKPYVNLQSYKNFGYFIKYLRITTLILFFL